MTSLSPAVEERTLRKVTVAYVGRDAAKEWNKSRKRGEVATFCGYYWYTRSGEEAGPFKSVSAAIRHAYYQVVLKREQPKVHDRTTIRRQRQQQAEQHGAAA